MSDGMKLAIFAGLVLALFLFAKFVNYRNKKKRK